MIRLTVEQVLSLHRMMTRETGGDAGLRDRALLESALAAPFQTFGGEELYPTLADKAARLGFSLISNHAFVDGNKRIGVLVMLVFLLANGVRPALTNEDALRIGLGVASGEMSNESLLSLLRAHMG